MIVRRLALTDFRNYRQAELLLDPAVTIVTGANGQGKTNLVEALAWLATLESFRGAPEEALVREEGAERAVLRADVVHGDGREVTIEAEIPRIGRRRVQINRQRLVRNRDLLGVLRVTVFAPDDLALVKEGPSLRRRFLDEVLVALHPSYDARRLELERVVRQRTTLLKQAGGRLTDEVARTLDVWDAKLAAVGDEMGRLRAGLVSELEPLVEKAYAEIADTGAEVQLRYEPPWLAPGLGSALQEGRSEDVRRQATLVGPHRDDVSFIINGLPFRTHASQGEQRSLALALKLASHALVTERTGAPPLLVLDDVFSELDAQRAGALVEHLPSGQIVVTSAVDVPVMGGTSTRIIAAGGFLAET